MKKLKIISVLLLTIMLFCATGCSNSIKGKYYYEGEEDSWIQLKSKNVVVYHYDNKTREGTYEEIEDGLNFIFPETATEKSFEAKVTWEDDKKTKFKSGDTVVYKKR